MTMYELKKDIFEVNANGIKNTSDIENAFLDTDFGGRTILKTESESEALAELSNHKSTAYTASGTAGKLISGDVAYIEKYEAANDGEFVSGADFIFAAWSTNIFDENN